MKDLERERERKIDKEYKWKKEILVKLIEETGGGEDTVKTLVTVIDLLLYELATQSVRIHELTTFTCKHLKKTLSVN